MLTCNIGESFSFLLFLSLPFSCRLFPIPYFFLIRSLSIHYSTRMCNSRFSQTKQHSPLLCCRTIPSLKHLIFPIAQTTSLAAFRVARRSPLPKKITESHSGRSISRLSDHTHLQTMSYSVTTDCTLPHLTITPRAFTKCCIYFRPHFLLPIDRQADSKSWFIVLLFKGFHSELCCFQLREKSFFSC
jgi:hypothetical protein